jgi:hypothetical protein
MLTEMADYSRALFPLPILHPNCFCLIAGQPAAVPCPLSQKPIIPEYSSSYVPTSTVVATFAQNKFSI